MDGGPPSQQITRAAAAISELLSPAPRADFLALQRLFAAEMRAVADQRKGLVGSIMESPLTGWQRSFHTLAFGDHLGRYWFKGLEDRANKRAGAQRSALRNLDSCLGVDGERLATSQFS